MLACTAELINCTITLNLADSNNDGDGDNGGIYAPSGDVGLKNTVVADNLDTPTNAGPGDNEPDLGEAISTR